MTQVSLLIKNNSTSVLIEPIVKSIEGKDLNQAVGLALMEAHRTLNKQWDAPVVIIADYQLESALVKKISKSYLDFQIEFAVVRETILGNLAVASPESRAEYFKLTDKNGVFKGQKSFTLEQTAAQAKERIRVTRDLTRWVKEDAKSSVVPEYVAARRLKAQAEAKAKRIAAKAAAALENKA